MQLKIRPRLRILHSVESTLHQAAQLLLQCSAVQCSEVQCRLHQRRHLLPLRSYLLLAGRECSEGISLTGLFVFPPKPLAGFVGCEMYICPGSCMDLPMYVCNMTTLPYKSLHCTADLIAYTRYDSPGHTDYLCLCNLPKVKNFQFTVRMY